MLSAFFYKILIRLPFFRFIRETSHAQYPITFRKWFYQKVLGFNKEAYWPVHHRSAINQPRNVYLGVDTCPGYNPGCYIQGIGKIYIGDYTIFEDNVGIISANHFMLDIRHHIKQQVIIGKNCFIGKGSIILPNVELGDYTIVEPGSVVNESFREGNCIIAGNPAKLVTKNPSEKSKEGKNNPHKYHGYIDDNKFEAYRKNHLWI